MFWNSLLEALLDSLKMMPFLLASYLLIELLEHHSEGKFETAVSRIGKTGPIIGAVLGLVPQCGFSVTAANLFGCKIISTGTLIAVFIATSDEAIPVLISSPGYYRYILILLAIKLVTGVILGLAADAVCHSHPATGPEKEVAHYHLHEHCDDDCCEGGIFKTALKHTLSSWIFLFAVILVINLAVELIGEENLSAFVGANAMLQPVLATLVGLIPSCAPSLILTGMFVNGVLNFGALVAGLTVNAGVGVLYLFRCNENKKTNIRIVMFLSAVSLVCGYVCLLFVK